MFSCFQSSSDVQKNTSKRKLEVKEENCSYSVSRQLKETMVRIVHAGGRIEMYQNPIPASQLIHKYPGSCITTPDVFSHPHESVLSADDMLLPGRKYLLMRSTALKKLKNKRGRTNGSASSDQPFLMSEENEDVGDSSYEESISSARDFFVSKESWSNLGIEKTVKGKRPFVPPIRRPRLRKEHDWEPSLTSIQELSP